jgi:hypothetical protein
VFGEGIQYKFLASLAGSEWKKKARIVGESEWQIATRSGSILREEKQYVTRQRHYCNNTSYPN